MTQLTYPSFEKTTKLSRLTSPSRRTPGKPKGERSSQHSTQTGSEIQRLCKRSLMALPQYQMFHGLLTRTRMPTSWPGNSNLCSRRLLPNSNQLPRMIASAANHGNCLKTPVAPKNAWLLHLLWLFWLLLVLLLWLWLCLWLWLWLCLAVNILAV